MIGDFQQEPIGNMEEICSKCGRELVTVITFPNGGKEIISHRTDSAECRVRAFNRKQMAMWNN